MAASDSSDVLVEDPEHVGVVWVGSDRAVVTSWEGEPIVRHTEAAVLPRRRAVGSVRRGPARPFGGGPVAGHGTEMKYEQEMRAFLTDLVARLSDLGHVEVAGPGLLPAQLADLLRRVAARRGSDITVTTRALSRRPSDRQFMARLRKLVQAELPRRRVGRYRLPAPEPTTATGRPLRPAAGRRTLQPPRLPKRRKSPRRSS